MSNIFYTPTYEGKKFTCPHCGIVSKQRWYGYLKARNILASEKERKAGLDELIIKNYEFVKCDNCEDLSLWKNKALVYPKLPQPPKKPIVPPPNPDMSFDIQEDYNEAATILEISPRGSAALLRLCIQKICKQLGEKGKDLNEDIGNLVKKGLTPRIQKALDVVRVVGNNAVHPTAFHEKDDIKTAKELFKLVNMIAEDRLTREKELDKIYDMEVPEAKKKAIEERDKQPKKKT